MYKNTLTSYGSIAKLLHWLIFFLVLCMICVGYFMDEIQNKAVRSVVYNAHKITGLSILALMILRVIWMLINPRPVSLNTKPWEKTLERFVHGLLYLLLITMPVSGWIMSSAAGKPPHLFHWTFSLPVEQSKALAELFVSIHNALAVVIIVVVSLHAAAAMYHHVIKKDNVLNRMSP